jgi:hypothetical protein
MDLYVPVDDYGGWKAHEWHHVYIYWNDTKGHLMMWVDGEKVLRESTPTGKHPGRGEFVRLNCRRPADEFQVGAMFRYQNFARHGLFKSCNEKWFTQGCNATMREVRTYGGPASAQILPNRRDLPSVYMHAVTYRNRFRLEIPPGVGSVKLGTVSWTTYDPPKSYGDGSMKCSVDSDGDHLLVKVLGTPVENGKAPTGDQRVVHAASPFVDYSITFMPYSVAEKDRGVFSPVLDDITITYFLPKEKVFLYEEVLTE